MMNKSKLVWGLSFCLYFITVTALFILGRSREFAWLSGFYNSLGFKWQSGGDAFSTMIVCAVASFLAAHIISGIVSGWPGFVGHNKSSLKQSVVRFAVFSLIVFFAIGIYGSKVSNQIDTQPHEYFYASVIALIFAGIVTSLNNFVEAIYIALKERK